MCLRLFLCFIALCFMRTHGTRSVYLTNKLIDPLYAGQSDAKTLSVEKLLRANLRGHRQSTSIATDLREHHSPRLDIDYVRKMLTEYSAIRDALTTTELNVSPQCLKDYLYFVDDVVTFMNATLRDCSDQGCLSGKYEAQAATEWILQVLDALGSPTPGFYEGNTFWWGSFSGCRDVTHQTQWGSYVGQYCLGTTAFSTMIANKTMSYEVTIGLCYPTSCTSKDVLRILTTVNQWTKNVSDPGYSNMECRNNEKLSDHPEAIAIIAVASVWLLLILVATFYDFFQVRKLHLKKEKEAFKSPKTSRWEKIFLSFSLCVNMDFLLNTTPGQFCSLDTIRVFSLAWIIFGHNYRFVLPVVDNPGDLHKLTENFFFDLGANAALSVDSFYVLRGFMEAFAWFTITKDRAGKNLKTFGFWASYFVGRYLILTPVYMCILAFDITLLGFVTSGPLWDQDHPDKNCLKNWWLNMLYINNHVDTGNQCLIHTYYIANDMQFHVFAPVLYLSFHFYPILGGLLAGGLLLTNMIWSGYATAIDNYPPNGLFTTNPNFSPSDKYMTDIFIKPWMRWGPFIVGIILAYALLHKLNFGGRKIRIPKVGLDTILD